MTLQQLIYAVTVAEEGSINKAAQNLFISQSSLSQSLMKLEEEISLTIFRRTNRGIEKTPVGEEFLTYARQIVDQYRLAEARYVDKKETRRSFSVSCQHYTFAVKAFVEMARRFRPDEYAFGIYEGRTSEVIDNVRHAKSELGILYIDDFNESIIRRLLAGNELEFTELFPCRTYVYMAAANPLSEREVLTLEDLKPYPCLAFDQGSNTPFAMAEEVFSTYHYRQIIKVSDRATMLNLMIGLNGYTLCSGIICEELNGSDYVAVPLASDSVMHIGYISRSGVRLSHLGLMYLEELKKFRPLA